MLKTVPIESIKVGENARKDFDKVEDIAKSIQSVGLLLPLAVREDKDGTLWLLDGAQRLRALKKLETKEVPVNVLTLDDQQGKEAQMVANLMRSDLKFMERARGFLHLLNDKAKYNAVVIAKKFGLKEKQVQLLIRFAQKIDEKCDPLIQDPENRFSLDEVEILCQIPRDKQVEVAKEGSIHGGLQKAGAMALQNTFGEVFKVEGLISSGKAFYINYGSGRGKMAYTFDKAVYEAAKKEWEQKNKNKAKTYAGEEESRQGKVKAKSEEDKASAKKERERIKKRYEQGLADLKEVLPVFFKRVPAGETREKLATIYLNQITVDECKAILRAFKVEFKTADMGSAEFRKAVWDKVLKDMVKTDAQVIQLWSLTEESAYDSNMKFDLPKWVKGLKG